MSASMIDFTLPAIGQPWPGIDGIYAGISRGEDGEPDAHLVLLNAQSEDVMSWDAAVEWAKGLGDGARLPTGFESALLYANVRDKLDTSRWHWTGTQYSSDFAWYQDFSYGDQDDDGKKAELRARAVRRLNAQSFNPKGEQAQDTDGVAPSQAPSLREAAETMVRCAEMWEHTPRALPLNVSVALNDLREALSAHGVAIPVSPSAGEPSQ